MALDFSNIDIDAIMDDAAEKTDDKLAGQISSVTHMTDEDIKKLFPKARDEKGIGVKPTHLTVFLGSGSSMP